jgi:hypothetical protein
MYCVVPERVLYTNATGIIEGFLRARSEVLPLRKGCRRRMIYSSLLGVLKEAILEV